MVVSLGILPCITSVGDGIHKKEVGSNIAKNRLFGQTCPRGDFSRIQAFTSIGDAFVVHANDLK